MGKKENEKMQKISNKKSDISGGKLVNKSVNGKMLYDVISNKTGETIVSDLDYNEAKKLDILYNHSDSVMEYADKITDAKTRSAGGLWKKSNELNDFIHKNRKKHNN